MANLSDFLPAVGGGGGGIPKYEEFTSSGTFTPSQALIDAGGRVSYIAVGGGKRSSQSYQGGEGGTVKIGYATLTSTNPCSITIGAGGTSNGASGGNTIIGFSSAGDNDVTATGGTSHYYGTTASAGNHGGGYQTTGGGAGSGTLGYGGGGASRWNSGTGGNLNPKDAGLYGGGSAYGYNAGDGFVRITWFE